MKKITTVRLLVPILLLATTGFAEAEKKKEIIIRRQVEAGGPQMNIKIEKDGPMKWVSKGDDVMEKEKVAFLGVETMPVDPTVAAQLGLARNTGVVVRRVSDDSPASAVLQPHDILTKFDDQILINMAQLTVLVRNHKVGDEVKLTFLRGGKEMTAKAKLSEREVPKMSMHDNPRMMQFFGNAGPEGEMMFRHGGPGMPDVGDVMRRIGGEQPHWFAKPRVHVFKMKGGKGSSILDLPAGSFVLTDDQGSVEINNNDGQRELTVKNQKGEVTFKGPINSSEDHKKLPAEVTARLDAIGAAELGDDNEELEVETKVLTPGTKTMQVMPVPPKAPTNKGSL